MNEYDEHYVDMLGPGYDDEDMYGSEFDDADERSYISEYYRSKAYETIKGNYLVICKDNMQGVINDLEIGKTYHGVLDGEGRVSIMELIGMTFSIRLFDVVDGPTYPNKIKWEGKSMKLYDGTPTYKIGQVIDISYKGSGLPNRIMIKKVFMDADSKEWEYMVLLENTKDEVMMAQSFIKERICHRDKYRVYGLPVIIRRYAAGYRFCGNLTEKGARDKGKTLKEKHPYVESVRMCEAYDSSGCPISDKVSLWIRYKDPISDNGSISPRPSEFEEEI